MSENEQKTLPPGWAEARIRDITFDIQPGFASGDHNLEGIGVPHLRPMNINREGKLDLSSLKYVPPTNSLRIVRGDVLFNNTNSPELVGKTTSFEQDGDWAFSNHMTRLRPQQGQSAKFIAYQLHYLWMTGYFRHRCTNHVNQASISSKTLAETVSFHVAPTNEQYRIVEEIEKQFSRLDAGVAALKRVQAGLKRYRASVLQAACEGRLVPTEAKLTRAEGRDYEPASELLKRILAERRAKWEADQLAKMESQGKTPKDDKWKLKYKEPVPPDTSELPELPEGWCWASVEQVSLSVRYGSSAKTSEDIPGVPVLRMGNISNGKLDLNNLKYLPENHNEFPDLLLKNGDLLFNRTNSAELVGKSAVYHGTPSPCSYASYLIAVRTSTGCLPDYLGFFVNSSFGRAWVASVVSQQVGQANVNGTKLQSLVFPMPPLPEQQRIIDEVERRLSVTDELESTIEANLKRAERLRQSILKRAFEGKLVPQDPNDEPVGVLLEKIRKECTMKKIKGAKYEV